MKSLTSHELSQVSGGFGALLGAALQAAGPIMQGVTGIIGAAKSGGGGGGGAPPPAAAAGGGAPPPAPPPMASAAGAGGSSTGSTSADGLTQITTNVSITR
jgi:hypothetical protein